MVVARARIGMARVAFAADRTASDSALIECECHNTADKRVSQQEVATVGTGGAGGYGAMDQLICHSGGHRERYRCARNASDRR